MTNLHSLLVSAERLFLLFENINRAVYMWQVKGLFLMRQNILHLRIEYTCWKRDLSIDSTKEPLALEGLQLNCHGSSPSSPPNRPRLCGSKTAQMRQKWVFVYVVNCKESMTIQPVQNLWGRPTRKAASSTLAQRRGKSKENPFSFDVYLFTDSSGNQPLTLWPVARRKGKCLQLERSLSAIHKKIL